MQWFEPLIAIAAISFVLGVIFLHFYLKKKGKSLSGDCSGHCSGSCSNCSSCKSCDKMLEEFREMYPKNK